MEQDFNAQNVIINEDGANRGKKNDFLDVLSTLGTHFYNGGIILILFWMIQVEVIRGLCFRYGKKLLDIP